MTVVNERALDPGAVDDGVWDAMVTRNLTRLPELVELGRTLRGEGVGERHVDALASAVDALPRAKSAAVVADPLYSHWSSKVSRNSDARWILELGRLILLPHLRGGTLPASGVFVPVHADAAVHVPGLDRVRAPGTLAGAITRLAVEEDLLVMGAPETTVVGPVDRLVDAERRRRSGAAGVFADGSDPWATGVLTAMNDAPRVGPYPRRDITPLPEPGDDLRATFAEALRLLAGTWPEAHAEVTRYTTLIVPFHSRYLLGWSTPLFQGAAFIRAAPGDVLFTFERIVHESAHQRLFAIQRSVRIHDDPPGRRLPSALRKDPRPTAGVYHAAFVCGRLVQAFARALERPLGEQWEQRYEQLTGAYFDMSETLHTHASLTRIGRDMLTNLDGRVRAAI
ncbi:HEXXH motif-containing putative peptide modification protein [Actinomadura sp. DC4]|uniref:aKG-HExxH-type peptide beta-hydroxylase n=1 Tax=Actinomadura sp. DC4 TaxID=3055069 RepID=UPI0025B1A007|nr:HEXXH motif-containing putative peptide modification protein [Actinomadura sp. DC4]MDN3354464.1 HEXXH motif-containing putative peptide modification protein [Actinomadura sp. DC4]